jgi:hydrogenase maturation protease
MSEQGKTLVLGLGNEILRDEGFGVQVARMLKKSGLPDNIVVEEGGVGGFDLLGKLEGIGRLIVVDVMMMDAPPGELRLMKAGPELSEPGKTIISFHQVGVIELVNMWGLLGYKPEIDFLVTRPEVIEWGTELSPALRDAAERAVNLLENICLERCPVLERRN